MARAMSSCARSSTDRAPGATFWRCTPKRHTETDNDEARSSPSHRGDLDVHSRGAAHHRRSLWQGTSGPRHRCRTGDEDESVSADGPHAQLLAFLSGDGAGPYAISY